MTPKDLAWLATQEGWRAIKDAYGILNEYQRAELDALLVIQNTSKPRKGI